MKNKCIAFLIGCFSFSLAVFAQPDTELTSLISGTEDAAFVKWEASRHDFGLIPQGTPVTFKFMFKNIHSEPLIIDNVRTSCGCTALNWNRDPILPGETSEIKITYNARKEGQFEKSAKVFLRGQKAPETLIIEGEVDLAKE